MLSVLVNCEESATVRREFEKLGWDAWSCDLVPSRVPGNHLQMDARKAITLRHWTLIINHPPCTYTALCGNRWYWNSPLRPEGVQLCKEIWEKACKYCDHVALEQPKTIMQKYIGPRTQAIQPFDYGHGETKETWLWLKNLPPLTPTNKVDGREHRIWKMPPGPDRQRERSVTYPGIAQAMAEQWTAYLLKQPETIKKEVSVILSKTSNYDERYWLRNRYIRWGRIEKDINALIDGLVRVQ